MDLLLHILLLVSDNVPTTLDKIKNLPAQVRVGSVVTWPIANPEPSVGVAMGLA